MIHFPCGLLAFKALPPLVPSSDHSFGSVSYIYAFNAACLPACFFLCTRETCFIVSSSATPLRTSSNPFHPSSVDPFPPPLLVRSSCCTFHSISTEPPLLYHKIIVVSSSASSHLGANDEAKSLMNRLLFEVSSCGGAFPEWDLKLPTKEPRKRISSSSTSLIRHDILEPAFTLSYCCLALPGYSSGGQSDKLKRYERDSIQQAKNKQQWNLWSSIRLAVV